MTTREGKGGGGKKTCNPPKGRDYPRNPPEDLLARKRGGWGVKMEIFREKKIYNL